MKKVNRIYTKNGKFVIKKRKSLCTILLVICILAILVFQFMHFNIVNGADEEDSITKIANQNQKAFIDNKMVNKIKPENYGDWAEYKVDLNDDGIYTNDWKIFYNNGTNVFLIAADYLDNSKIPENAGITTNGKYNVYWDLDSTYANKNGMGNITQNVADQFMLRKYKEEYGEATDINSKATAVLLDTSIWEDFAAGYEGCFAYGGPTVEMWTASWNEKGYGKLENGISKESHTYEFECLDGNRGDASETFETNGYGYRVGKTAENLQEVLNVSSDSNGYNDPLYFPHTSRIDLSDRYFMASPTYRSYTRDAGCNDMAECVSGESEILVSTTGQTIKAKDLQEGNDIVYYDFYTETNQIGRIAKKYIHEQAQNFVKYTFEDGSYLEATDYHPIYTKEGWKSLTQRGGCPIPEIGDEVKTFNGFKKITDIKEYSGLKDYYDFDIETIDGEWEGGCYYANDTLVESSTYNYFAHHTFTDYMMDCLVSCSYEGNIENSRMDIDRSNAALRPIVVLPTNIQGALNESNVWTLGEQVNIITHHLEDGTNKKLAEDEIQTIKLGSTYTTTASEDVLQNYNLVKKTENWTGTAENQEDIEVTYWYTIKKYKITTDVEGTGGTITDAGLELCEEVEQGKDSKKNIVIIPEEGYYIESIEINGVPQTFTANEDGTYILDKFENMMENKNIVVKFAKKEVDEIIIKYVYKATQEEIAKAETIEITVGEKVELEKYKKDIEGYTLIESPEWKDGQKLFIYYYDKITKENPNESSNGNNETQNPEKDNSLEQVLPKAGKEGNIILTLIAIILIIGIISYIKYRNIKLK